MVVWYYALAAPSGRRKGPIVSPIAARRNRSSAPGNRFPHLTQISRNGEHVDVSSNDAADSRSPKWMETKMRGLTLSLILGFTLVLSGSSNAGSTDNGVRHA